MAEPGDPNYRYSVNEYPTDGVQTEFEISFAGGYINEDYVNVRFTDSLSAVTYPTFTFVNQFTISVVPAPAAGGTLMIFRDTPADLPLVDFNDAAIINEAALDLNARQAVHLAAETRDIVGSIPSLEVLQSTQAALDYALNRNNHTGAQAISTVTGLQAALDALSGVDAANLASLQAAINLRLLTSDYTSTAADKGPALLKFTQGLAYTAGSIAKAVDRLAIDPRNAPFNAVGDGVTDDAVALQAALTAAAALGRKVFLAPGTTYAFGTRLLISSYSGFIGGGKLLMLTGAGKFDRSDHSGDSWVYCGVYALNATQPHIECEIEMQANASVRTCSAIAVRGCTDPLVNVRVHGFGASQNPLVAWDSNTGGHATVDGWDCGTSDNSLTRQITLFCIDASRTGAGNSSHPVFDINGRDIMVTGAAAQAQGYQSDICNIQTTGYLGAIGRVRGKNAGEILDCFADGCIIQVIADNAYEYGCKLIHGAENNIIFVTVNNYRRYGIVLGSDNTTKSVRRNRVYGTVSGGGLIAKTDFIANVTSGSPTLTVTSITAGLNIAVGDTIHTAQFPAGTTVLSFGTGSGGAGTYTLSANALVTDSGVAMKSSPAATAAVATDGTSATYKPVDNHIEVSYTGDGIHQDYGVLEASGSRNTFVIDGSGDARKIAQIDGTAGTGANASRVRNSRRTLVRAYCNAQSVAPGSFVQLQYGNEVVDITGEFDPSTYTFTATSERDIVVSASLRTGGAGDQKEYDLQVKHNGSEIFRKQNRVSGSGDFSCDTGPIVRHVAAGDTITVFLNHNEAGSITISSSEAFSRLHIWEV